MHCSRRLIVQTLIFSSSYLHRQVSAPETLVMKGGTTWARNGRLILLENARLPRNILRSFTCRKSTTWDKRLYFHSERRRAEDFFVLKNATVSAGSEPANLSTKIIWWLVQTFRHFRIHLTQIPLQKAEYFP